MPELWNTEESNLHKNKNTRSLMQTVLNSFWMLMPQEKFISKVGWWKIEICKDNNKLVDSIVLYSKLQPEWAALTFWV